MAREAAKRLGGVYVDSGALYRGVTWKVLQQGLAADDSDVVARALGAMRVTFRLEDGAVRFCIDGDDPGAAIRSEEVAGSVSHVAAVPEVRQAVTGWLREMTRFGPLVMEGRDIGTVVFPETPFKFFLTARADVRARRRRQDLARQQEELDEGQVLCSLCRRDEMDSARPAAPLRAAPDAIMLDTSDMTIESVVRHVVEAVRRHDRGAEPGGADR